MAFLIGLEDVTSGGFYKFTGFLSDERYEKWLQKKFALNSPLSESDKYGLERKLFGGAGGKKASLKLSTLKPCAPSSKSARKVHYRAIKVLTIRVMVLCCYSYHLSGWAP